MMSDTDIVFRLLQASLTGTVAEIEPIDTHRWWNLFRLLQKNHVAALAAESLAKLPKELQPPRDVLIPWLAEQGKAIAWYQHQLKVQNEISVLLKKKGIETLVLKGSCVAKYYPKPELREFGDLDLYFYDRHNEADRLVQRYFGIEIANDINHHTKYNLHGVTIESHYHLLNQHPRSNHPYEILLQPLIPSPTFEVLFLLRHAACHFAASRITLRDLIDWALTCRTLNNQVDWELVKESIEKYGMTDFASALCIIVEKRLGVQCTLMFPQTDYVEQVERDIVYGNPQSAERDQEDIGRLVWKLRRYRANRWKQRLVFNDSAFNLFLSSLTTHTRNPHSILHKQ